MLFLITIYRPAIKASIGMSLYLERLDQRYCAILVSEASVLMLVYIDTASAVNSFALEGNLRPSKWFLSSAEFLMYVGIVTTTWFNQRFTSVQR